MITAQAVTLLNLYQVTRGKIHTLHCFQPCLGQTGPHQTFQTLIDQTRPLLVFQTYLSWTCLLTTKKQMKNLWLSFYCGVFVAVWILKILCLNKQTFVNILRRLLHVWWWLTKGVKVRLFGQRLFIKVPVLKKWSLQHGTKKPWSKVEFIPNNIIHQFWVLRKLAMQVI